MYSTFDKYLLGACCDRTWIQDLKKMKQEIQDDCRRVQEKNHNYLINTLIYLKKIINAMYDLEHWTVSSWEVFTISEGIFEVAFLCQ